MDNDGGRMRIRAAGGILLLTTLVAGCAAVTVTEVGPRGAERQAECRLDVYLSEHGVNRAYNVVCLIDSVTGSHPMADTGIEAAINRGKNAACRCGADAVILTRARAEGVGVDHWQRGSVALTAIRYGAK